MPIIEIIHKKDEENERVVTYEGCVLAKREENYHDDSDFYAAVWDEGTQSIKRIDYATTRCYTYGNNAIVDATDEVKEKAKTWMKEWLRPRVEAWAVAQAERPEKGKKVEVVGGRKHKGETGTIFWEGVNKFSWNQQEKRFGIKTDDGEEIYVNAGQLRVTNWKDYLKSMDEISAIIESNCTTWHMPCVKAGLIQI